ncbi:hypothetical protein [Cellulomonas sp. B6]|uniref:hypothetical protein n=1 Tax=Cellulomonas sp. B6 TaxID=1295626 RepID=UPI0012375747|nr:hypothetical protein [Cellulomonas sp. B6]
MRARVARTYLDVAELAVTEDEPHRQVAAGLAALAAIAAADAVCGHRTGDCYAGQDHARAGELLERTQPDGAELARHFRAVIRDKSAAHYGTDYLTVERVTAMLRHARHLVDALASIA